MNSSIQPKMLLLSVMLVILFSISTATPMERPTSYQGMTLQASDIDTVILPRIKYAVRSLISEYKMIANTSGSILYGAHVSNFVDSTKDQPFYGAILERKGEMISKADTYFSSELDKVMAPTHYEFMREARRVMEASKEEVLTNSKNGVNIFAIIDKILDALEPVEQALKEQTIDFLMSSFRDILKHSSEVVINVIVEVMYPRRTSVFRPLFSNILNSMDEFERGDTYDWLTKKAKKIQKEHLKSSLAYKKPAKAKKLLQAHFLLKMNGSSSILRKQVLAAF